MLKTWAARHWAAHGTGPHGTGPHGTGPHGTGPHGTGPKFFRDGAASGPSCHTPPCYLLRGTAALAARLSALASTSGPGPGGPAGAVSASDSAVPCR
jgi:hypothetical protein